MNIVRFGDTYAGAYAFPRAGEIDTWSISRPAIYTRVGGLPGAFDYYGDDQFPYKAMIVRKSFIISAATYAAVETAINALKAATIDIANESKLWGLKRDGSTTRWIWAKCISLRVADQKGQIYYIPAEVEFFCREACWYDRPTGPG